MKTYSKPTDTPNKHLRSILDHIDSVQELRYLVIIQHPSQPNRYCIANKYVGGNVSDYMVPARLLIWFDAYAEGTKNILRYNVNKEYEFKLIYKNVTD